MRLNYGQVETIRREIKQFFGAQAEVWLSGSRVANNSRGGGVGLYLLGRYRPIECRSAARGLEGAKVSNPLKSDTGFQRGFTLVELIVTIVIIGILAVVAVPRLTDSSVLQSRGFADQVLATLRHAQKIAIAQHRFVCVAFGANSVTLTYDPTAPSATHTAAACSSDLTGTTGQIPYVVTAPGGVTLSGGANFNFNAQGKPSFVTAQNITVSGYGTPVTVEAETGYVH